MNRRSLSERIALGLARFVAGPDRRRWLDAMDAELDHLSARRLDWALGTLVAAVKDRTARDWPRAVAILALPSAAMAGIPLVVQASSALARTTGLPHEQAMPLLALASLTLAQAIGATRTRGSGGSVLTFAGRALAAITLSLLFALLPPSALFGTIAWCAGAWLGARWMRADRGAARTPSR